MAKKKSQKKRGSRTHGRGKKAGRGAGLRGGRGQAGAMKHKKVGTLKENPKYWGDYGFTRPQSVLEETETLNVHEVDERVASWLEAEVATEEDDGVHVDLSEVGVDKLLGSGRVDQVLHVSVESASNSAVRKIEAAGGSVTLTGTSESETDDAAGSGSDGDSEQDEG